MTGWEYGHTQKTRLDWLIVVTGLLAIVGCSHAQGLPAPVPSQVPVQAGEWKFYYDVLLDRGANYFVPRWTRLSGYTVESLNSGYRLTIHFSDTIPPSPSAYVTVEVYFDSYVLVYSDGGYTYCSNPPVGSGQAGIVEMNEEFPLIAYVPVTIQTNRMVFEIPEEVGMDVNTAKLVVVRYVPTDIESRVAGGINACVVSLLSFTNISSTIPDHPNCHSLQRRVPRRDESLFPPGASWSCPPEDDDGARRGGDYDRNGKRDWDYPMDKPIDNGKMVDLRGLDKTETDDRFVLVVGEDRNGNGELDDNEIEAPIGECPTEGGINYGFIDENGYIHWINRDPRTGFTRHFIYNPQNGGLKVYIDPDGDGKGGHKVYPPPSSGQEWGDPNGYHWDWKRYR